MVKNFNNIKDKTFNPVKFELTDNNNNASNHKSNNIMHSNDNIYNKSLDYNYSIHNNNLTEQLDSYSIEDIIDLKIGRFFDQLGNYYPDNVYELIMSKVEKSLISQVLKRVGGNQVHTAKILGINRNTLRKKMKIYGL